VQLRAAELVLRHATAADSAWILDQVNAQAVEISRLQEIVEALHDE
jgi:hypothetical protein